jgi:LysM repeat protein
VRLSRSKYQAEAASTPPNLRAWEPARLAKLDLLILIILVAASPIGLAAARSDWQRSRLPQSTVTPSRPNSTPTLDPDQPVTYVVQAGDTLTQIADKFGLALAQLLKLNQLQSDAVIVVGQKLIVGSAPATPLPSPTGRATAEAAATPSSPTPGTDLETITPTPSPTGTATSTAEAMATPPPSPTLLPQPTAVAALTPPGADLPIDVIVVLVLMGLAVIGLIIGFRVQRG